MSQLEPNSDQLLPCPFCGNEMHFILTEQPVGWRVGGLHSFWCPFTLLTHNDCDTYVSKEAAANAWNRRAE